jgi:hypothetical protein
MEVGNMLKNTQEAKKTIGEEDPFIRKLKQGRWEKNSGWSGRSEQGETDRHIGWSGAQAN